MKLVVQGFERGCRSTRVGTHTRSIPFSKCNSGAGRDA